MMKTLIFADTPASEFEAAQYDGAVDNPPASEAEAKLVTQQFAVGEKVLTNLGKKKERRSKLIAGLVIADISAIVCSFVFAFIVRFGYIDLSQLSNVLWAILPIYFAIALNNKAYQTSVLTDLWKNVSRSVVAFLMAASAMLLILFFFKSSSNFSRLMFGIGTVSAALSIIALRSLIFRFSKKYIGKTPYADLCVYDGVAIGPNRSEGAIEAVHFGLVADPGNAEAVNRLGHLASGMDHVIVHCPIEKRSAWVSMLRTLDIQSEIVVPELDAVAPLRVMKRNGRTSLLISSGQLRWDQKTVKRIFDILVVLLFLPFVLIIMIIVAIAIKLDSKGPIFFTQTRIGLGNRPFKIWKFRSMETESTDRLGIRSTSRNDDRITRVGRLIRSTSIDELPQIVNVLEGSMSIIGPRPHALGSRAESSLFWDIDQRYWQRHVVKPGLTGLAQIRGYRGATEREVDLSNRLQSDLEYVTKWSLWSDIKIFLKTFSVLLHKNAY